MAVGFTLAVRERGKTKLVFVAAGKGKRSKKAAALLLCLEALAARAMRFVSKKKSRHCFSCLAYLTAAALAGCVRCMSHLAADTLDGAAVSLLLGSHTIARAVSQADVSYQTILAQ